MSAMSLSRMASWATPAGLTLIPGGSRQYPLNFTTPPRTFLGTHSRDEILEMLAYAGVHYRHPESPAAAFGARVFEEGRALGRHGSHEAITFDWDHTLSNYQIFEHIAKLIRVRS